MRHAFSRLFYPATYHARRSFSRAATTLNHDHFFVDTNVIIGYRLKQYPGLAAFIEQPNKHFYYTETVLQELQAKPEPYFPEANPNDPNAAFNFIDSHTSPHSKAESLQLFYRMWDQTFMKKPAAMQLGYGLTERQKENFRNDLYIIMEASSACHRPGVLPDDYFRSPPLLTFNMQLWKKFIAKKDTEELLETAINLTGHEHLLEVHLLPDLLDAFESASDNTPHGDFTP